MSTMTYHEENQRKKARYTAVFAVLAVLFCVIFVLNINTGNVQISVPDILRIVFLREGSRDAMNIVWKIRLPRLLMGAILGGALSVSGFLLQTYFQNPIAGPFVLGISSGAKMVVSIVLIFAVTRFGSMSSAAMIIAAFVGSLVVTGFILVISRNVHNMAALLVAGVMVGYICSAVTDFIETFADDQDIVSLHGWSKGSFSGMSWTDVRVSFVIIVIAMVLTSLLAKPIGAYQMGENYAQSMGVNIRAFRVALVVLSSVLSATVTAYAGPISFVGIAVPFLIKQLLGTARPLIVIPATYLGGAVFCMGCDLIARMAFAPNELAISTVTSVFGAPVVLFMIVRRQKKKEM